MSFESSTPPESREALHSWYNRATVPPSAFVTDRTAPELSTIVPTSVNAVDASPHGVDFAEALGTDSLVLDFDPVTGVRVTADGLGHAEERSSRPVIPRGASQAGRAATAHAADHNK